MLQQPRRPSWIPLALGALMLGCGGTGDLVSNDGAVRPLEDAMTPSQDAGGSQLDGAVAQDGEVERPDASTNPDANGDAQSETDAAMAALTETEWILHMREEEKLARDVYRALNDSSPAFANIAASEQQHMDAVATLLVHYNLADPIAGLADGTFATASFQQLYDQLVAKGLMSTVAALQVGASIEDLDLSDLDEALLVATHADVRMVLQNLAKGSRNHLRTFAGQLANLGASYTPQYIDAQTYASIITSPMEAGPNF